MKMRTLLAAVLCAGLSACGGGTNQTPEPDETEPPAVSSTAETSHTEEAADASAYVGRIENATIDPAVYLDYSAGIEAGVYQWILSEDGDYYTLAAVDENGEPLTAQESAINVGANNAERGSDGPGGEGSSDGGFSFPVGGDGLTEGGSSDGGHGDGMRGGMGGPGGMMFGGGGTVYQGVYMNANVTNLSNQTMLIYVPAAFLTVDENGSVT